MAYLAEIATAVPQYEITQQGMLRFMSRTANIEKESALYRKLQFIARKGGIRKRYSAIPDYEMERFELYTACGANVRVEDRMQKFREKVCSISELSLSRLFLNSDITPKEITHLIAVSCTGMLAPGFELLLAERNKLHHTEKFAVNFMGCYAAVKALKMANYIADADPSACVLVVCTELCSLHYAAPQTEEEALAYMLFGDGTASALVCGEEHRLRKESKGKIMLQLTAGGSARIPNTAHLMSWTPGSANFTMYLSKEVGTAIGENIHHSLRSFFEDKPHFNRWAVHPGGVSIIHEVQQKLSLSSQDIRHSLDVLSDFGNMSSATILFVLQKHLNELREKKLTNENIFACAFGPGITVEMLAMKSCTSTSERKMYSVHGAK